MANLQECLDFGKEQQVRNVVLIGLVGGNKECRAYREWHEPKDN